LIRRVPRNRKGPPLFSRKANECEESSKDRR
jgi:hypothetical protein